MNKNELGRLRDEACKAYMELNQDKPARTIGRELRSMYPELFSSIEAGRAYARSWFGVCGGTRDRADKTLNRDPRPAGFIPPSVRAVPDDRVFESPHKWFILSDVHAPFHDERALEVMLGWAHENGCDALYLNGDVVDNWHFSRHFKKPIFGSASEHIGVSNQVLGHICYGFDRVVYKYGNHCLDEQTECLTKRGWVSWDDVALTDQVLTRNADGTTDWQKPERIIRRPHKGKMVSLENRHVSFLGTPEHKCLFERRNGKGEWSGYQHDTAANVSGRVRVPCSANTCPSGKDNLDTLRLVGWLLTDSSIRENGGGQKPQYQIYQSKDSSEIERLLDKHGINYSVYTRHRDTDSICGVKLKSKPLPEKTFNISRKHSDALSVLVPDKSIPEWIHSVSNNEFDAFIEAVVQADGSWSSVGRTATVHGSERFLGQLQACCVSHGWRATLVQNTRGHYVLNICKETSSQMDCCDAKSEQDYDGFVWCVTVPNGNFMVRRNGKAHFTGNCDWYAQWLAKMDDPDLTSSVCRTFPEIFQFEEHGITDIVEENQLASLGKLPILHGHEMGRGFIAPVNPARGAFLRITDSVLISHYHRTSLHIEKTGIDGRLVVCRSMGCACQLKASYSPMTKWNHGFAVVEVRAGGNYVFENFALTEEYEIVQT